MEINSKIQLEARLNETIKTYNERRPHQSLHRMTPVEYEKHLLQTPADKRCKLKIYTVKLNPDTSVTKQLNLFEEEI